MTPFFSSHRVDGLSDLLALEHAISLLYELQVGRRTMSIARAGLSESAPNELLEAHADNLEPGAAGTAVGGHSAMATVGAVHGTPNR
jgi:hypothetical protein